MARSGQTDDNGRPPGGIDGTVLPRSQRLRYQGEQWQQGKDEHGLHTARIGFHATVFHKILGNVPAYNAQNSDDEIKHEDEPLTHCGAGGVAKLVREIGRCPEEIEPPHTVGHELAHDERPCLAIREAAQEGQRGAIVDDLGGHGIRSIILQDVCQLGLVHTLTPLRFFIDKHPESHPNETDAADDEERTLPPQVIGQHGNGKGCDEGTY